MAHPELDGTLIVSNDKATLNAIFTAEQIFCEYLSRDKTLSLIRLAYMKFGQHKVMLARTLGLRQFQDSRLK